MPRDVREFVLRRDLKPAIAMAKTNEEKEKLSATLFKASLSLENHEISSELRDELIAASFKLLDRVPLPLTAMDVHRFLAGDLAVSNKSAEFKEELIARCEAQARWVESRVAAALEPGAYQPTVRDELIASYEQQLRNIELRVSTVRAH
jgi:hypothetical protein